MNPFTNLEKENKPQKKLMTPSAKNSILIGNLGSKRSIGKPSSVSKYVVSNHEKISRDLNQQTFTENNLSRPSMASAKVQKLSQEEKNSSSPVKFTSNIPVQKIEDNEISLSHKSKEKLENNIINDLNPTSEQAINATYISSIPLRPLTKSKRKFTEIQKEKEQSKKELLSVLTEFISLYDNYVINKNISDEEFIKNFEEILSEEILVNFSKLLPESLNSKGSCLLENSKFFILYIKFKIFENPEHKISLDDFIRLIDNCLLYDQNDMKLIYDFFTQVIRENYTNEDIMEALETKQSKVITEKSDLNENHFKYLLSRPESFLKFELDSLLGSKYKTETFSKKMKLTSINSAFKKRDEMPELNLKLSEKKFNAGLVEESLSERVKVINLEDGLERKATSVSKFQPVQNQVELSTEVINITNKYSVEKIDLVSRPEHGYLSSSKKILNAGLNTFSETSGLEQSNPFTNISVHEISQIREIGQESNPIIIDQESQTKSSKSKEKVHSEESIVLPLSSQRHPNHSLDLEDQHTSIQVQNIGDVVRENANDNEISGHEQVQKSPNNKSSSNLETYREKLIQYNKLGLEIEQKSSLTIKMKTPKNKTPFKMNDTLNFSYIPEVDEAVQNPNKIDDVKMHQDKPEEPQNEIFEKKSKNNSRRAKSSYRPSKKKNISEEEEEKTAEDIEESDTINNRKNNNKSVKNKKRYQSDKKGVQDEKKLKQESSEEEMSKEDSKDRKSKNNKNKKTKTKDTKEVKIESSVEEETRRSSNIASNRTKRGKGRSVSASAKESEEEEPVVAKRGRDKTKVNNKKEAKNNKSKTAEKKKKKK